MKLFVSVIKSKTIRTQRTQSYRPVRRSLKH